MKYDTIDNIVKEFLFDSGETTLHKYPRYLSYALAEARDWNFDSAREVKTVVLIPDDVKQAELPGDFVDYVKVGIQCGDIVKVLNLNENMVLRNNEDKCGPVAFDSCGCSVNKLPSDFDQYGGYQFSNYGGGTIFGYGSGYLTKRYFQIYRDKNKIQFSSDINSDTPIYMEYIGTGFDPCSETLINPYAKELIKAAMDYKRLWFAGDPRRHEAKEELVDRRHQARFRVFILAMEDILANTRRNSHQAAKG